MLNRCEFIGNLGKAPEIRTTQGGDKVANFSIAVTERWKDKNTGEKRESTTWVPVVVWGALAGLAEQYLRKGSKVFVAGKFTVRKWQDQSGADRYSTEVVLRPYAGELTFLDSREGGGSGGGGDRGGYDGPSSDYGNQSAGGGASYDDDIPFAPEWRV